MNRIELNITVVLFLFLYFLFSASSANDTEGKSILTVSTYATYIIVYNSNSSGWSIKRDATGNQSTQSQNWARLELKNEDKNKEMRFLKNIISDCVIIHHHHSTLYDKNLYIYTNIIDSSNIHFFCRGREKEKPFIGPPSNCNDLNKIGYTLNGLYLVKDNSTINSKISVIFSDFQAFLEGKRPSLSLSKRS